MTLRDFWPLPDAVTTCAPPEAEALSDAALLAVHQPVRLFRRSLTDRSAPEVSTDERAVLDELLATQQPEGYAVVLVVGPSGAGKSHLVRWLGLHLAGNRHVRVPKGASPTDVLESVLDGLEGPAFDAIREQLRAPAAAREADEAGAVEELLNQFRAVLRKRAAEARAECDDAMKRDGKVDPQLRTIAEIHGPGLLALLEGPTKDVLLQDAPEQPSVFRALARRTPTDEPAAFDSAQFEFPTVPTNKLSDQKLQRYVQKLKTNTQNERDIAAALLNDVRDEVARQPPAADQTKPADLFRKVREELLKEGKELVLLLGTVTAGAETRELFDVITTEGVRAGEQVLCTLRVALASEEPLSDAFTTRINHEFVLHEQPADEDELFETITDLVGAHLNAARLGPARLDEWAAASAPDAEPPSFDDSAELSDEDRTALACFGTSRRGHSLFPFNRAAIQQLATQYLAPDGQLLLNPCKLITDVLHATLLPHRDAFLRGAFPPEGFHKFDPSRLDIDVELWLQEQRPDDYGRYAALLGYWGDQPRRADEVELPAAVYTAFGLTPLVAREVEPAPVLPAAADLPHEEEPAPPAPGAQPEPIPLTATGWANDLPALVAQSQLFADRAVSSFDIVEVLSAYRKALSAAWAGWVRSQTPRIDDAELVPFETNPDYQQLVEQIRKWLAELRRAEREPATSAARFAAVEATAAQLRVALGKLPIDAPADVKAFLAATNSRDGAALSALTPAVTEWLRANNQYEKYRIRR